MAADTRTFDEMYGEAMRLYREERYADVLVLINEEGDHYPEHAPVVLYLRSCMAARLGKTERALSYLQEALNEGYWYGVQVMRQSPSWQSLQGMPAFEQMVVVCRARQEEESAAPRLFVAEPEGGCSTDQPCPLLMALHGNGDNAAASLNGWRSAASLGWLVAALQSSQIVMSDAYVWDDQETAIAEIKAHYADLRERYRINADRVVIAGFSMGAETALRAALLGTIPAKGFILLGPGGPTVDEPEEWLPLLQARKHDLKGYVFMGADDNNILPDAVRTMVDTLNDHGIPCTLEMLPGLQHEYPRDFSEGIARAISFVTQE